MADRLTEIEEIEERLREVVFGYYARLRYVVPYDERMCEHGKRFIDHCHDCAEQGFCGCEECRQDV